MGSLIKRVRARTGHAGFHPLTVALCLAASVAAAPAAELGRLPIANFGPDEYGGAQQNWDVAVDRRGVVWVANSDSLLEYDGAGWRAMDNSQGRRFWSLDVSSDGTIWVGASGEFGYLEADASGRHRFVSLAGRLDAADSEPGDIRQVLAAGDEGVFFRSHKRIFRWLPPAADREGRLDVWRSAVAGDPRETTFDRMAWLDGRLVVGRRDHGLMDLRDGQLRPVAGTEALAGEAVMGLVLLPSGRILAAGFRRGLFVVGETTSRWETEADAFARDHLVMGLMRLRDGRLALSSFRGGLAIFDRAGTIQRVVGIDDGLRHNELMNDGAEDDGGGLWLALNNGLARVEVGSPIERFDELPGLEGSVIALSRSRGELFVGTTLGVHVMVPGRGAEAARFELLPGVRRECWALRELDGELWAATSDGVYPVARPEEKVFDSIAFDVADLGGYRFVATWRSGLLARPLAEPQAPFERLEATADDVRVLVPGPDGDLWLRSIGPRRRERIERLALRGPVGASSPVRVYDSEAGLPRTGELSPFVWQESIYVGSTAGLFRYEPAADGFVQVTIPARHPDEPLAAIAPAVDDRGRLWLSGGPYRAALIDAAGERVRVTGPLEKARLRDIRIFFPEPGGSVVWVGSGGGRLVRWREPSAADAPPTETTLLRSVRVARTAGRTVYGGAGTPPAEETILDWEDNALRFEFALPVFAPASTLYRSRLVGQDDSWSPWTAESFREFTALREGGYRFEVQGRGASGVDAMPAVFAFRVRPPRHRSSWAYALYALAAAAAIWAFVRWRLRHVSRRVDRLSLEVERRRRAQAERERLIAELEERNTEMERFLYTVSHDLKTPLITVRGFVDLLQQDLAAGDAERVVDDAERIRAATDRMMGLVRDQLELARIGRIAEPSQTVSMGELAREAISGLGTRLEGVEIEVERGLPEVLVDRSRMLEVFENLLENAVRFRGDEPRPKIEIGLRPGAEPVFYVRDNGIGIAPAHLNKIFDLFRQLHPVGGGTGIGLAIVRRIIEVHGGRIWAESEGPGTGATFCFTLPGAS